jgi:hypothetical protein
MLRLLGYALGCYVAVSFCYVGFSSFLSFLF